MKEIELAFSTMRPRYLRWMHLIVVAIMVLGLGITQGAAAPNNNSKKPILTKSGKKAALQQAAEAILLAPAGPTDGTKVPHYFGPFPNWANSPFTLPDVTVTITGDGMGAAATATVGTGGAVTGITITNPGSGYTTATVDITGAGTGATADAVIDPTVVVTAINVVDGGAGYTAPLVTITGGGATTDATATAYGGVDAVALTTGGSGYTFPTVDFDMPDGPDGVKATAHALTTDDGTGNGTFTITGIMVDSPGSGYSFAPNVVIRDGTIFDPIKPGGSGATATATLTIQTVVLETFGAGYTSAPTVDITDPDPAATLATATAVTDFGAVTGIANLVGGSGYLTAGGIKKFQDGLPKLCDPSVAAPNPGNCTDAANNLGQYVPLAVPDTTTFPGDDYYVIALVQTREQMNTSLPPTLLREYVQLETTDNAGWSKNVQLANENLDPNLLPTPILINGQPVFGVDNPHFLGPVIAAAKDRPVRVLFYNLLPTGQGGDLFIPKDSTIMGSGPHPQSNPALFDPLDDGTVMDAVRNPFCTENPSDPDCFKDNRATLHLHGGITPWISDGTPHQWNTPGGEDTPYPEGVSQRNVPDMWFDASGNLIATCAGQTTCAEPGATNDPGPGAMTFYWTNQQSARLMFYHDHAWGITRLNVYAGQAAGYLIQDPTEQALLASGTIPADQIPLVIQDRTFVPDVTQLSEQDPTWDYDRWGGYGDFWYHHVYMPAQNPGDPTGMSAFGRWMYGPWFWPPATPPHGPIANPYYDPSCNLNDPATWLYQTDPFCEPELIPGTPNISVGMEQFNDTPIVNGTAYPTLTVEPKAYRLRILNAANDRFFNFSWYVADPASETDVAIGPTEVALNPVELAAAQLDPNIFPTPDTSVSPAGPDWIVIGSEGGFLPAPVVVPAQPTTWIIDPTVFNVGNVDKHSLLVAPAERFDVIVDFSQFEGKTLILYNDAPAAFPARVASYDYYTGAPDLSPVGAPTILPGYGPNTRTVMQVKVQGAADAPFNVTALKKAFLHKADGSGVFESGQHPIIVGQAGYNSAYGTNFVASGYCNGGSTSTDCDGYLRIADQGGTLFGFNTLLAPNAKLEIPIEPKAIHDEMNATAFDEYGRMQANIGLEAVPATPALQNFIAYPYVNPPTEMFDATNLPKNDITVKVAPIASADGTQIWKITHNGVDTHPLHWHLYDVQVLNRVTWDNIVSPPDPTELGWKDTLRVSPLEDTIVALRPIIPQLPFELPNSIRPLHPMMPLGSSMGFNNIDPAGNPTAAIANELVNFGWEYVWHCHILSHEEMDMMRPVSAALPPKAASITGLTKSGSTVTVTFTDNSLTETSFQLQRTADSTTWTNVGTPLASPLNVPNTTGASLALTNSGVNGNPGPVYGYRVAAVNTVGYGGAFPSVSAQSVSNTVLSGNAALPAAPTNLTAAIATASQVNLTWTDNATNENGFVIQRSTNGGAFGQIGTAPARNNTGSVTFADTTVVLGNTYTYRVAAVNGAGLSAFATSAAITVAAPGTPTDVDGVSGPAGGQRTAALTWTAVPGATSYTIQWSNTATGTPLALTGTINTVNNATSGTQINVGGTAGTLVYMQVRANNVIGSSLYSAVISVTRQ
ncbi:MAG: multicopper oxidase domain-containing protein [Desulfobacterales bacterium]|nr:MAG: multicopper oxidase domain-containing protein [Desulfobacterales bacterium]